MSLLSWLADRLILCPSTRSLDAEGKRREVIETNHGDVECWVGRYPEKVNEIELVIIKFPGTAGRAERAGVHPAEIWDLKTEIWTVNPKGYGGSSGPASIKFFPDTAVCVYDHVARLHVDVPVVAMGNSLGGISALHVSARREIAGLILRNPPPLQQMICQRPRYAAWNFGLSRWIAAEVPDSLDAIENAGRCSMPCLFVQSERDRMVPTSFQNRIIENYGGSQRVFVIRGADHHELIEEDQQAEYFEALGWLKRTVKK